MWTVCIFWKLIPCWLHYLQIFSPHCRLSFHFVYVSFAVQKLVRLIMSHLFIFAFISVALGEWPKKILIWFMSENVLLCYLLEVLWCHILHLSLNHFKFAFVHDVRVSSNIIDLHAAVYCLLKRFHFSHFIFLHP